MLEAHTSAQSTVSGTEVKGRADQDIKASRDETNANGVRGYANNVAVSKAMPKMDVKGRADQDMKGSRG